jgi:hypothetical protein
LALHVEAVPLALLGPSEAALARVELKAWDAPVGLALVFEELAFVQVAEA